MLDDFDTAEVQTGETTIFVRRSGSGPPILLLHGFPQTHLMWRSVAPILARHFTVICADLRGYGRSGCPRSAPDHEPYSKRAMARDMVAVMERLGFRRFSVVDDALGGWGSSPTAFSADVRAAYVEALRDPARVHAICEEYRAAATCDREHDQADPRAGRRIAGPVLALWSGEGPLNAWYAEEGGPLALWRSWADDVHGHSVDAGHFFPEEIPGETADALTRFFR